MVAEMVGVRKLVHDIDTSRHTIINSDGKNWALKRDNRFPDKNFIVEWD